MLGLTTLAMVATTTALPASSPTSSSSGSGLNIINNLSDDIYLWTVTDTPGDQKTLSKGNSHSETWQTNSNGGGVSIKLSTSDSKDSVLQFEYTQDGDTLYWDLSSINLNKDSSFVTQGFKVTTDDDSCKTAQCDAGDSNCAASYQHPDDVNTNSCRKSAAFTLTLG
ncbi:hypothetical protein NUU61_008716 [Penicillium alfredii]|uniref:Uncharacterized protein n=1 Tax=Penicillium alfredii TaxID=1506179 RepID=A0A9W9JWZ4_9EURO|nr:uncharacterized protein NUU61_008716 [Penicillium alfredii]KAJ5084137.1 hypothetical protein NUU61_008716 [Penicillium alfredii]